MQGKDPKSITVSETGLRWSGEARAWRPAHRAILSDPPEIEYLLTVAGGRPMYKREDLDLEAARRLEKQATADGLSCRRVPQQRGPSPVERGFAASSAEIFTLFAAGEEAVLEDVAELDAAERGGGRDRNHAIQRLGELLGYPACCVRAFAERSLQDDQAVLADFARSGPATAPWINNFLPPLVSPVTWYPCRPDCPASAEQGMKLLELVEKVNPARAEAIRRALPGMSLAWHRFGFLLLQEPEQLSPARWSYGAVGLPSDFTTAPALTGAPAVRAFEATVGSAARQGQEVRLEKKTLFISKGEQTLGRAEGSAPFPWIIIYE